MGRERGLMPRRPLVRGFKDRHRKAGRHVFEADGPPLLPPGLVAKPAKPIVKSKHKTILEFVDNDVKKKLGIQITPSKIPPPGYEYVPVGNPELTMLCKEISREQGAVIFVVSLPNAKAGPTINPQLSLHMNRIGHHILQRIVKEAQEMLGDPQTATPAALGDAPEPIPLRQAQINAQADAAIRELFPRIPNTDRQMIIDRAFRKGSMFQGNNLVGLASDIPLSRRVQLAVLAHIRHNHTTYDELLRMTSRNNARKVVENLCLDIVVKWRGDEENGRDDLDVILKEVVVISDDEDEEDQDQDQCSSQNRMLEGEPGESSADEQQSPSREALPAIPGLYSLAPKPPDVPKEPTVETVRPTDPLTGSSNLTPKPTRNGLARRRKAKDKGKGKNKGKGKDTDKDKEVRAHRGFKRYQAAWEQAIHRSRQAEPRATRRPGDFRPVDAGSPATHAGPREMASSFRTETEMRRLSTRLEERPPLERYQGRHLVSDHTGGHSIPPMGPDMRASVAGQLPPPAHLRARDGLHHHHPVPAGGAVSTFQFPRNQPLPSVEAQPPNIHWRAIPPEQPVYDRGRFGHGRDSTPPPLPVYGGTLPRPLLPRPVMHVPVYPDGEPVVMTASPRYFGHGGPEPWVPSNQGQGHYIAPPPQVAVSRDHAYNPSRQQPGWNAESNEYHHHHAQPPIYPPPLSYGHDRGHPIIITDSPPVLGRPLPLAAPPVPVEVRFDQRSHQYGDARQYAVPLPRPEREPSAFLSQESRSRAPILNWDDRPPAEEPLTR